MESHAHEPETPDKAKVTVTTATSVLEGWIHLPKTGKGERRLTNLLNMPDKRFLAMTNVLVADRVNPTRQPESHPFLEVNLSTVEFIKPH
jgi:hypothetical protein